MIEDTVARPPLRATAGAVLARAGPQGHRVRPGAGGVDAGGPGEPDPASARRGLGMAGDAVRGRQGGHERLPFQPRAGAGPPGDAAGPALQTEAGRPGVRGTAGAQPAAPGRRARVLGARGGAAARQGPGAPRRLRGRAAAGRPAGGPGGAGAGPVPDDRDVRAGRSTGGGPVADGRLGACDRVPGRRRRGDGPGEGRHVRMVRGGARGAQGAAPPGTRRRRTC